MSNSWRGIRTYLIIGVLFLGVNSCTEDTGIPAVTPPAPVSVEIIDKVTITGPSTETIFTWTEPAISFSGTKPSYSAVWISQKVDGESVSEGLLVPSDKETEWSLTIPLGESTDPQSNINIFVFKAHKGENKISLPIQVTVNYLPPPDPTDPTDPTDPVDPPVENPLAIEQVTDEANAFNSLYPKVAAGVNGETYVVWQQCQIGDGCEKTTIMASVHGGESGWGDPVEISPISDESANASNPDVAIDSSGVAHIVWTDSGTIGSRPGDSDILYRTWDGTTAAGLGTPSTASVGGDLECTGIADCANVYEAKIALAGDSPRVVFRADGAVRPFEVYYATSVSGTWSATQLSDGSLDSPENSGKGARKPGIVTDVLGNSHVVWQNKQSASVSHLHYRLVGDSMGTVTSIELACESGLVITPTVTVDDTDHAYVAWISNRDCNDLTAGFSVFYAATDNAGNFGTPVEVTSAAPLAGATHQAPQIAVRPGAGLTADEPRIIVTWSSNASVGESGEDYDILLRRYDGSGSGGDVTLLSEATVDGNTSSARSQYPSVILESDGVLSCWQEEDAEEASDFDITCGKLGW